jgi:hypothetical protein
MNKLFSKIAKDAGIKIIPVITNSLPSNIECTLENLEKFFELIVRECAQMAGEQEFSDVWEGPIEDKIKKHFGVEE